MKKFPMTVEGAKRLRAELQRLKTVDRPAVSAGRPAAKERQGFIEGRIAEIEHKLAGAQVIDPAAIADAGGHVVFGATVDVEDATTGDRFTYQIVGEDEADLKHGKISVSSPIARALIGKSEGDVAEVKAPGGIREYEVLAIRYA